MKTWDISSLDLIPHAPVVLVSGPEGRAIALQLPAGESLQDHQVHEQAWIVVMQGEVEFTTPEGERISGGPGLMAEFTPGERHAVVARSEARLLLLLTPWPGEGHPSTLSRGA